MPELPEVETVRRSLLRIIGQRIEAVEVAESRLRRQLPRDFGPRLVGRTIRGIGRHGKYLLFRLSDGASMLAHLGMSGSLVLRTAGTPAAPHDHVRIRLSNGRQLTYNDPRRFGVMQVGREEAFPELVNVGPDPLSELFSVTQLAALVRHRKRPVKNLLMDQRVIGGLGNIYTNEILFRARIRPGRAAGRLTRRELVRLLHATRSVLNSAIRLGGSSIADYRDGAGRPGYFQLRLRVYARGGQPCVRCRTRIRRVVHAGRSSFYCPACQH